MTWSMTPVAVKELEDTVSTLEQSELDALLYDGVDQDEINYAPIFELAAELFTHLGIGCTDWIFLPIIRETYIEGT